MDGVPNLWESYCVYFDDLRLNEITNVSTTWYGRLLLIINHEDLRLQRYT